MNLLIDNRDTVYTIDAYHQFSIDPIWEQEAEGIQNEYGIDFDCIDFDFDAAAYVRALAAGSVNILNNDIAGDIVKSISSEASTSPRFYNYTTDSYTATWDVNTKNLRRYIEANFEAYKSFMYEQWGDLALKINWDTRLIDIGGWDAQLGDYTAKYESIYKSEDAVVSMVDYYSREQLSEESYIDMMYEVMFEVGYEHLLPTRDTQLLIDMERLQ